MFMTINTIAILFAMANVLSMGIGILILQTPYKNQLVVAMRTIGFILVVVIPMTSPFFVIEMVVKGLIRLIY